MDHEGTLINRRFLRKLISPVRSSNQSLSLPSSSIVIPDPPASRQVDISLSPPLIDENQLCKQGRSTDSSSPSDQVIVSTLKTEPEACCQQLLMHKHCLRAHSCAKAQEYENKELSMILPQEGLFNLWKSARTYSCRIRSYPASSWGRCGTITPTLCSYLNWDFIYSFILHSLYLFQLKNIYLNQKSSTLYEWDRPLTH